MISFQNKKTKVLVIGDLIIDHYLWGSCERISPEAPVPVINVSDNTLLLGGAGNVVNNLKTLGAKVDVISVIGECLESKELKELLENINVDTQYLIIQKDRIISKKSRLVAANQQVIRYDHESTQEINNISKTAILSVPNFLESKRNK